MSRLKDLYNDEIVAAMTKIENGVAANIKDVEEGWRLFVGRI